MYSGEKTWEELLHFLSSRNIRIGGFAKCGILSCQRKQGNSTEYFYFKAVEKPSGETVYTPLKQMPELVDYAYNWRYQAVVTIREFDVTKGWYVVELDLYETGRHHSNSHFLTKNEPLEVAKKKAIENMHLWVSGKEA